MARRRREFDIFSMSFLDTICCAFGAVVLLYMVINAAAGRSFQKETSHVRGEVDRLEQQVLEGYEHLVVARNSARLIDEEDARMEGLGVRILDQTERLKVQLAEGEGSTLSKREAIERLKADLKAMEEGSRRLEGGTRSAGDPGSSLVGIQGEGERHYLTGLKVRGERILLLVDASASMLDDTLVNILRLRNMPDSYKRMSDKWRRTVAITEWLAAHIPEGSKFQMYAFNTHAWSLRQGTEGTWLDGNDGEALNESLRSLRELAPKEGTSLENAFTAAGSLNPRPDRIILITDGLPTQGATPPTVRKMVSGDRRYQLFEQALRKYPTGATLSVILLPMEGDPMAASAFWVAARRRDGEFLMPAKDWP